MKSSVLHPRSDSRNWPRSSECVYGSMKRNTENLTLKSRNSQNTGSIDHVWQYEKKETLTFKSRSKDTGSVDCMVCKVNNIAVLLGGSGLNFSERSGLKTFKLLGWDLILCLWSGPPVFTELLHFCSSSARGWVRGGTRYLYG